MHAVEGKERGFGRKRFLGKQSVQRHVRVGKFARQFPRRVYLEIQVLAEDLKSFQRRQQERLQQYD